MADGCHLENQKVAKSPQSLEILHSETSLSSGAIGYQKYKFSKIQHGKWPT